MNKKIIKKPLFSLIMTGFSVLCSSCSTSVKPTGKKVEQDEFLEIAKNCKYNDEKRPDTAYTVKIEGKKSVYSKGRESTEDYTIKGYVELSYNKAGFRTGFTYSDYLSYSGKLPNYITEENLYIYFPYHVDYFIPSDVMSAPNLYDSYEYYTNPLEVLLLITQEMNMRELYRYDNRGLLQSYKAVLTWKHKEEDGSLFDHKSSINIKLTFTFD